MITLSCQKIGYAVVEDKGTAISFLMMSGESSWSPASAAVGEK